MTGGCLPRADAADVLVVDDHELIAEALTRLLAARNLRAVARAPGHDLPERIGDADAGLVLLDLDLGPGDDGRDLDAYDLVRRMSQGRRRVVILTGSRDRSEIAAALAEGAVGWLSKALPLPELVDRIVCAAAGNGPMTEEERRHWVAEHRARLGRRAEIQERLHRLSRREREVLEHLAAGHRADAIANRFVVSTATIRSQIHSLLRKLEAGSQIEAVAILREATTR
jgi:DNA-binding NarL/FixJ family response regulator